MANRRKTSNSYRTTSKRIDDLIADVQSPNPSSNPNGISVKSDKDLRQKISEINHCLKLGHLHLPPGYAHWFLNSPNESVNTFRAFIEQVYLQYGVFDIYWKFNKTNRKL
jgi:hypothetical protein